MIAVVTVAHGRHEHLRRQHAALARSSVAPDDYVVVAMDDPELESWQPPHDPRPRVVSQAGTGDGLPLAAARNRGARAAFVTGADLVVFLDVDCMPAPGLLEAYRDAAGTPEGHGAILCGPVTYLDPPGPGGYDVAALDGLVDPHPARPAPLDGEVVRDPAGHHLFWSLSFAIDAATWDRVGGFDESYVGYGAEDTDLGQRAAAAGVPLAWVGGAHALHQHHPTSDPPVQHVDDVVRNGRLFAARWGWWPMRGWLDAFVSRGLVDRLPDGSYAVADGDVTPPTPRADP